MNLRMTGQFQASSGCGCASAPKGHCRISLARRQKCHNTHGDQQQAPICAPAPVAQNKAAQPNITRMAGRGLEPHLKGQALRRPAAVQHEQADGLPDELHQQPCGENGGDYRGELKRANCIRTPHHLETAERHREISFPDARARNRKETTIQRGGVRDARISEQA